MSVNDIREPAAAGNGAAHASHSDEPGLLASVEVLWQDVRGIAHEHLQLAALETQRAGRSLVWLLVYGILACVLMLGAWVGALAALVLWLISIGLAASAALLLAAVLNVIAAGLFVLAIRRRSRDLGFPATLASLQGARGATALTRHP